MRGYFGIGVYHPKTEENIGTLWRSAYCFGASFIFTIGRRYKHQVSDTLHTPKHIPLFEFESLEQFEEHKPVGCPTICIELDESAKNLARFNHPERAIYLLGAEDDGLPKGYLKGKQVVQIEGSKQCLNVAVAGSIVLYDRIFKQNRI